MMAYQEQPGDYRVKVEQSDIDPMYFSYHFWHYQNREWKYLYKAPEVVMVENLRGHTNLYSADGYDYWRRN
ncbi:MAG: hypothetical protein ACRDIV_17495 [Ktedonobacteraceae bacterium]